jgi:DNA-binding XRE family transcriptional regulator
MKYKSMDERQKFLQQLTTELLNQEVTIADAVKRLRKEFLEMKQETFAQMCKISLKTLKNIEAGKGNPTINTINHIFKPFGLTIGILPKNGVQEYQENIALFQKYTEGKNNN